jgi:hypothetical protein
MVFTLNIVLEYQRVPVVVKCFVDVGLAEIPLYEFDSLDIGGENRIQRLKEPREFF